MDSYHETFKNRPLLVHCWLCLLLRWEFLSFWKPVWRAVLVESDHSPAPVSSAGRWRQCQPHWWMQFLTAITYERYLNWQLLRWRSILTFGIIALGKEGGRGGGLEVSHSPIQMVEGLEILGDRRGWKSLRSRSRWRPAHLIEGCANHGWRQRGSLWRQHVGWCFSSRMRPATTCVGPKESCIMERQTTPFARPHNHRKCLEVPDLNVIIQLARQRKTKSSISAVDTLGHIADMGCLYRGLARDGSPRELCAGETNSCLPASCIYHYKTAGPSILQLWNQSTRLVTRERVLKIKQTERKREHVSYMTATSGGKWWLLDLKLTSQSQQERKGRRGIRDLHQDT